MGCSGLEGIKLRMGVLSRLIRIDEEDLPIRRGRALTSGGEADA